MRWQPLVAAGDSRLTTGWSVFQIRLAYSGALPLAACRKAT